MQQDQIAGNPLEHLIPPQGTRVMTSGKVKTQMIGQSAAKLPHTEEGSETKWFWAKA